MKILLNEACNNMNESRRLLEINKTYEALERLKKILPKFEGTKEEWKIHEMIGAAFHDIGDAEGAVQAYFNAVKTDEYLRSQREHYSNYLFTLHYLDNIDNITLANEHFIYNDLFRDTEQLKNISNSSLNIGYLADNFLESSSARFYEALLTNYNRDEFKVKCFSLSSETDKFTSKIKSNVDEFITLDNISVEEAAQQIFDKNIDILFDLSGHSDGGLTLQIMSYKPAPIQITGIGWFDTTGLKAIDYILTDNYLAPIGHEKYFSEKLLRLNSAFAFVPSESMINNNLKLRITNYELTFACFNNFMKVTDEYLKCVKKILNKVTDSKFIMQDTTNIIARKIEMEERIKKLRLPIDRVEICLGNDDYLKDYADIDIILDTFPYNGGMMTATALYMGVPVICLYGSRHSSRFGADILRLANCSEWIASDNKNYIEIAISLAKNFEKLTEIKKSLRERIINSKLFDTKNFVNELEYQYKRMVDFK